MSERQLFRMVHDVARRNAMLAVRAAPERYVVEIKPPTRSLEQNARLHALIQDVADQVEWYGAKRSVHAWKRIFAAALFDHELVPGLSPGQVVLVEKRTHEMRVGEMTDLMALVESFGAEKGVVFKDEREREVA